MKISRYLKGNLSVNYRSYLDWSRVSFLKYWSGRLIYLNLGRIQVTLDCRVDIMKDMMTGRVE